MSQTKKKKEENKGEQKDKILEKRYKSTKER